MRQLAENADFYLLRGDQWLGDLARLEKNSEMRPTGGEVKVENFCRDQTTPRKAKSMKPGTTSLERAFEIARTGLADSLYGLQRRLQREGYDVAALEGRTLRKQLMDAIRLAKRATALSEGGEAKAL